MDRGEERDSTASLSDDEAEEERQLQKAIALSMAPEVPAPTSFQDQLKERSARMKRKAEEDADGKPSAKRIVTGNGNKNASSSVTVSKTVQATLQTKLSSTRPSSSKITIKYPGGALRITRTPGRAEARNCVNLNDLIHKEHLISACVFSFFIGENELYDHLPLSDSSDAVPIYIGRDVNQDPLLPEACRLANIPFEEGSKVSKTKLQSVLPSLQQIYRSRYGKNYNAFYAWSSGSSHTKMLLLMYPDFLRIVITSCNMMDIDTMLGDNHWYIHDVPKLSKKANTASSGFEADLLAHLQALSTPEAFINSITGVYDYASVKVHLVTSIPGTHSGPKAEKHGLLRLRRVIHDLKLNLSTKDSQKLQLEICAASLGNLNTKWLNAFADCALGKPTLALAAPDAKVPNIKLFYPSVDDVRKCHASAQEAASNIGCHMRPWDNAPKEIRHIFHHYESKDKGRLFHQKLVMAYNPSDKAGAPYFVYVGSANLSQSAWGGLETDKKRNGATGDMKLVKVGNFECGVVVPGSVIEGLLEVGTEGWREGIVPYDQSAKRYELPKDKAWNDPRWVKDYEGGSSYF